MGLPTIIIPEYSLNLPSSGKEIKYRPFLVKEEKILLIAMESEDKKEITNATKRVIKNCIVGDINIDELPTFDIEYIFLWLRGKAKGEKIDLKYTCPTCKNTVDIVFNIEDVKIDGVNKHDSKIKLNDTLGLALKYPTIDLQEKIESLESETEIDKVFKTVLLCVDYIYDNEEIYPAKDHTEKEMNDFLESLTDKQFQEVAKFFETMPKLKHDIKLECKHRDKKKKVCGYTEDITLEGLASFFG
jgi:hypothetical protein